MSVRGPFVRSGGASVPLPTIHPPAPTGLPSPLTPTSSSSYSSNGTQSTIQQNTQSSTSPSSSPTTSEQTLSAPTSTPFSSLLQSDASTDYKGSEPSTDTLTSISPSSHSSMSTGGGAPTNGPPPGGEITTLPPPVSMGGTTSQNSPSPTTFGPANNGPATSVLSDAPSPSPPSKEPGPSSGDLLSIILPSLLPSSIFTLPSSRFISPPLTIPTSPPSFIHTSLLSSILTLPPLTIPTLPPSSILTSLLSSILTSPPLTIPTSPPLPPTQKVSAQLTTSQSSTLPGQETSSRASSSTTPPISGNPTTTSSTPSSSADKPSTTSDTNLSTPLPGKQTSSQQSTSLMTSTITDTTTPGKQTFSQQSTPLLTLPTSGNPKNAPPISSITSSTSGGGTPLSSSSIHGPSTSPTTVPGAQSFHAPQSSSVSSVNTPIPTGNGFTVSSAGSPMPSGSPMGNPSSTTLHSPPTGVAENVMSTTSSIPPRGYTFSSIIYTSIGTSTIITYSSFGSTSVPVTLISTSMSVIRTTTSVPTSGVRSNEAPVIGGIVGGVLALLLLCIAACYLIRRRRRSRAQQQLYDSDITAPLSPAEATTMREKYPYSLTYRSAIGGQGASHSRGDLHHAANSFGSSAFPHPSVPGSSHNFSRSLSGSVLDENFDRESNNGDISSDNESEGTERYLANAHNFLYNDGHPSLSGGMGIAIGSQSSMDLHSYHTAVTMLVAGAHAIVDNDEECYSPGPSPSAFPVPPVNPFFDGARVIDFPDFVASHASQSRQAVSALSEEATLNPVKNRRFSEQQASWAAAVAAASPVDHDAPTPIATRSLNALIEDGPSSQDLQTPTQSRPPVTPFNDSYFIIPFLLETSQEGFSDDSGGRDSHETVSVMYPYPFEPRHKGKGKEYLSAEFGDDTKNNRLSNASSSLVFPENPSQCGLAI